jgi:hypothetical protein
MSSPTDSDKAPTAPDVEKSHTFDGQGTDEDPFVVEFVKDDPENPMNWGQFRKWFITTIVTLSVFAVTYTSSAYSVSSREIIEEFNISNVVFIIGVTLYVLGFAIGPALWGPLVSINHHDLLLSCVLTSQRCICYF